MFVCVAVHIVSNGFALPSTIKKYRYHLSIGRDGGRVNISWPLNCYCPVWKYVRFTHAHHLSQLYTKYDTLKREHADEKKRYEDLKKRLEDEKAEFQKRKHQVATQTLSTHTLTLGKSKKK